MKIVTAQEMQHLDKRAIEEYGIPGLILMENAGVGVVREMIRRYGPLTGKTVTVVAGKGNNGGDGFVVARHFHQQGVRVRALLLGKRDQVKDDARVNLSIFEKIGGEIREMTEAKLSGKDLETAQSFLLQSDLIVDAIFGTGLTPARPAGGSERSDSLGEGLRQMIPLMNQSGRPTVAVDIPSGVCSDTGEVLGEAVMADLTVTFGLPKRGHYLYPGASHRGVLKVVDIGIPKILADQAPCAVNLLTQETVRAALPARPSDAHKGRYGHVLVIGGSVGKTGAAAMAAQAALRMGAGLVTLAIPSSLNPILEQKLTEVMTVPLPETPEQALSLRAEKALLDLAQDKSVVILGPGLSAHPETQELARKLIRSLGIPIVLDADGINALAGHTEMLAAVKAGLVLTPHPGEMGRLIGSTSQKVQKDRLGVSQSFAQRYRVWLVLKGAFTVLAEPGGSVFINPTGNEGMATGGTGDVLAGMLGGLISQGLDPLQASQAGVYLHGLAGDLAASQKGGMGMIAGDMVEWIPAAILKILDGSPELRAYNPLSP